MTKILVVGLAMVLAAAGSAFADGNSKNGQSDSSSATGTTSTSSGSSGSQQSGTQQSTAASSSGNRSAPAARHYPAGVSVQNGVQTNINPNWRVQRPLDRAELLARQAAYFNRNQVNPVQGQG